MPDGAGGNVTFTVNRGDSIVISSFGGIGPGVSQSAAILAELDRVQFVGSGLTASNMLLTQVGEDVVVTFAGVADTQLVLQGVQIEDLDNLTLAGKAVGNFVFNGQSKLVDNLDIIDESDNPTTLSKLVSFLNDLDNLVTAGATNLIVNAQDGNDTVTGGNGNQLFRGGLGDDSLSGGGGNDTLAGDDGSDTLLGGIGNDSLPGGAGFDSADGGTGNDVLVGGADDDTLVGGDGADKINGGSENDSLAGDAANDTVLGDAGFDWIEGGAGNDKLDGGNDDDALIGGTGNDTILGGAGYDFAVGGDGQDRLEGGDEDDYLFGEAGNDTILGGNGFDELVGDGGNDSVLGGADWDRLWGLEGKDILRGEDGDDVLEGGAGNDSLNGGEGTDLAVFSGYFADYKITVKNGTYTVKDLQPLDGDDGTDKLTGIEWLLFADAIGPLTPNTPVAPVDVDPTPNEVLESAPVGTPVGIVAFSTDLDGDQIFYEMSDDAGLFYIDEAGVVYVANELDYETATSHTIVVRASDGLRYAEASFTINILDVPNEPIKKIDLATLTPETGSIIYGAENFDWSGYSVAGAGDVNGDGFDDVIIGAQFADGPGNSRDLGGEAYVVFGGAAGMPGTIDLGSLSPEQGFVIYGETEDERAGMVVSSAGDLNGDGFDEIVVVAKSFQRPSAYVIFGTDDGFDPSIDLASLAPDVGFQIVFDSGILGSPTANSAADLNGDGFDDLVIGNNGSGGYSQGKAFVVWGKEGLVDIDLFSPDPAEVSVIIGADPGDSIGPAVSPAGDVNGDGYDDLLIGAPGVDGPSGTLDSIDTGGAYVVFGSAAGFAPQIDLENLTPDEGFLIQGIDLRDNAGLSVAALGDFNGDGFDDLVIGTPNADGKSGFEFYTGEAYLIFGTDKGFGSVIDLGTMTPDQGFVIYGQAGRGSVPGGQLFGLTVATAGDINGDGLDDLLVSEPGGDVIVGGYLREDVAKTYVIYGTEQDFDGSLELSKLAPSQGFAINGIDADDISGMSARAAGDVNGDGFDDLIIGAYNGDAAGNGKLNAGESYVVYGGNFSGTVTFIGTAASEAIVGTESAESFVGGQGDDTLTGNGGIDAFQGGSGDDLIVVGGELPLDVNGGSGIDTVALDALGATIDLTGHGASRFAEIEVIDLGGGTANALSLDLPAVLALAGTNGDAFGDNTLLIKGDVGDSVALIDGWTPVGVVTDPFGQAGSYTSYVKGAATVLVETDVAVVSDSAPTFAIDVDPAPNLVAEDAGVGTIVGLTAQATDPDAGDVVSYSLVDDAGGRFAIDAVTCVVTVAGPLDFESAESHSITVRASDGDFFSDKTFSIAVADVEDTIDLAALAPGQGSIILGADRSDQLGFDVSSAGDVNGDGFDDVVISAPYGTGAGNAKGFGTGEAYVIFGTADGLPASLNLASLTPDQGFVMYGIDRNDRVRAVAGAGDINGDGFDDVIVGAQFADAAGNAKSYAGEVYVIFGTDKGFGSSIDLGALTSAQGMTIHGGTVNAHAGFSVNSAGDLNGDGLGDMVLGATLEGDSGRVYVIFGTVTPDATIDLAALTPAQGFVIGGGETLDLIGWEAETAGDINGDGFDDLVLSAPRSDGPANGRYQAGDAYVLFGSGDGFGAEVDLSALTPDKGFVIYGAASFDGLGYSVSGVGDVNGDGFEDLAVTAIRADGVGDAKEESGEVYLIFGTSDGFGSSIDLAALSPGQGITLFGVDAGDWAGRAVSGVGDVNGDGFDDLIVSAPRANGPDDSRSGSGEFYLLFGSENGFDTDIDLGSLSPLQGWTIYGARAGDFAGIAVAAAGDVNGDGFDDILMGANGAPGGPGFQSGEGYVIYGNPFSGNVVFAGSATAELQTGTAAAENFVAGQGDDTMVGNGGGDVFHGGAGDDVAAVSSLALFLVDGGSGTDTLRLDGAGLALDLTALADSAIRSVERIDINGSGANTLTVSVLDVLNLSEDSNQLLVDGGADDTASIGTGWTAGGTTNVGGQDYQVYTAGEATLLVDVDVNAIA